MTNHGPLLAAIAQYVDGRDDAGDAICASLRPAVHAAAARLLAECETDADDIAQETLLTFLRYLRRAGSAPDNPEAFVTTMARNRCLNLFAWRKRRAALDIDDVADRIPDASVGILDVLARREREAMLNEALAALDKECRDLLEALYRQGHSAGDLMVRHGLGSVQAVYYRRNACLRAAQKFLNRRLFIGRHGGTDGASRPDAEGPQGERS